MPLLKSKSKSKGQLNRTRPTVLKERVEATRIAAAAKCAPSSLSCEAESRRHGYDPCCISGRRAVRRIQEIRMVENIKSLGSKLKFGLFANREISVQPKIDLPESIASQSISA